MQYLKDFQFLSELDKMKIQEKYIKLTLLTFDEKPIKEIQGTVSSGSMTVNGSAAIRRTINLTMLADKETSDIQGLDNLISLNKKTRIAVGLKNPLPHYKHYGDIIWFPLGLYLISSATLSHTTNNLTISIQGKDKMALLDGSVGGTLPASVTFHERYEILDNGEILKSFPTIFQIIFEAVHHYGGEAVNNIIISDIEETAKLLLKYSGDTPIWFDNDFNNFVISETEPDGIGWHKYDYGRDIGYLRTDFTYPGQLILNAGQTVVNLLDTISKTLGNFEYFYDIDGKFRFQEKKNYLNKSYTPIVDLGNDSYVKAFSDTKYAYTFKNDETIVSYNNNPKYDNIKNDFIVWGKRTSAAGTSVAIRYHLAVDEKPNLDLAKQYMSAIEENGKIVRYEFSYDSFPAGRRIGGPCNEWREELYRQALIIDAVSGEPGYYDQELLAEWRKLYDPLNETWTKVAADSPRWGWNPAVFDDPGSLQYWLEFIDTSSSLGLYSVNKIGRRSKVLTNDKVASLFNMEIPDIVFFQNTGNIEKNAEIIKEYNAIGQKWCMINENQEELFASSATGASAFDQVRELLYQHLIYNTAISITCVPRYYLEPNVLIYIQNDEANIKGAFNITQFTLPLAYSGTMNISANEALNRV